MTEKEKAMAGMLYDANYDEALAKERVACKELCWEYNQLRPSQIEEKTVMIKKIIGKTGENFWMEPSFWCDYGYNIEIGDNCFIAPNCGFYTAGHALDTEQRNKGLEIAQPITVGNNVWIGGNVIVLPGVTIGDDTVIGGGSVVTKDIPQGVIAAGNPCRVIREITEADKDKYKRA